MTKTTHATSSRREFGIVGLGRIGGGLAAQALRKGLRVVGLTRGEPPSSLVEAGLVSASRTGQLLDLLAPPRVVFLYVPAGATTSSVIDDLGQLLEPGDIIVDGGNSYWGDSARRADALRERGLHLLDLGTSGGVRGAEEGACFMLGGDRDAAGRVEPLLRALALDGGYVYAGESGAGHYVKLVHNGIEFGMLQAIAEGVDLLEHYGERLPVADVLRCWRHGSVIRSWLVDLMEAQYRDREGLCDVPDLIEDTGEVNWLISDALQRERPIPVIAQSVMQLFSSRDEATSASRAVALMRRGFGGHPLGADESIATKRRQSRVAPIYPPEEVEGVAK